MKLIWCDTDPVMLVTIAIMIYKYILLLSKKQKVSGITNL